MEAQGSEEQVGVGRVHGPPPEGAPGEAARAHVAAVRVIDCAVCVMADTTACDDCVVTFVVNRRPGDAIVVDAAEERALRAFGESGLVPRLRHRRRVG